MIRRNTPRSRLFITFRSYTWPSSCSSTPRGSRSAGPQGDGARTPRVDAARRGRPRRAALQAHTHAAGHAWARAPGRPSPASGPFSGPPCGVTSFTAPFAARADDGRASRRRPPSVPASTTGTIPAITARSTRQRPRTGVILRRRRAVRRLRSPASGRLAQLVRAPALQAGGPRFEPGTAHRSEGSFSRSRFLAPCCAHAPASPERSTWCAAPRRAWLGR